MKMVDFDYAIVHWIPSVVRGEFRNVGVVLHAPTAQFLDGIFVAPIDAPLRLRRYLDTLGRITRGEDSGGPLAALPRSERFHWLIAPRSDSIQTSPCHPGRARVSDLDDALDHIFAHAVAHGDAP